MGEKMDKAVEEVRKAVEEEMEAARAEGKVVKVIKTTTTTTITDEETDLDKSPQVIELEKEITHLKRQVADQIGNIETLLKQRDKSEKNNKFLRSQVFRYANAANCKKPRGSCRTCTSTPCYFKDKMKEEK
jgi:phenylalanyl-tRNA synthetase alpha subunit